MLEASQTGRMSKSLFSIYLLAETKAKRGQPREKLLLKKRKQTRKTEKKTQKIPFGLMGCRVSEGQRQAEGLAAVIGNIINHVLH